MMSRRPRRSRQIAVCASISWSSPVYYRADTVSVSSVCAVTSTTNLTVPCAVPKSLITSRCNIITITSTAISRRYWRLGSRWSTRHSCRTWWGRDWRSTRGLNLRSRLDTTTMATRIPVMYTTSIRRPSKTNLQFSFAQRTPSSGPWFLSLFVSLILQYQKWGR